MSQFKGKKVLITGGASGIGRLMGKLVLQKGAELIIWDINPTSISETVAELQILGKAWKRFQVGIWADFLKVGFTAPGYPGSKYRPKP